MARTSSKDCSSKQNEAGLLGSFLIGNDLNFAAQRGDTTTAVRSINL